MGLAVEFEKKLNRLLNIYLSDGVQPGELADNIFEKSYNQINSYNDENYIYTEVSFTENIDSENIKINMLYTYSKDRKLLRIEEKKGFKKSIQWDRENIIKGLVDEITGLLKQVSKSQAENFINALPDDIKTLFKLKEVSA